MKDHAFRRHIPRRVSVGASAIILAAAGSVAVATPSQANVNCSVSFFTSDRWYLGQIRDSTVFVDMRNTSTATSTGWVVYVGTPGTLINYYGVQPMPEYGPGWYKAKDSNRAIPPGQPVSIFFTYRPAAPMSPDDVMCSLF
jgi:hypothetical protein